ncbi:hypothetical protein Tco_0437599, partial [Tanacetum coccineum]
TCVEVVTYEGGGRVVIGVTKGISGIGDIIMGSRITEIDSLIVPIKEVSKERLRN